jgi:diguanylate cyclase (GGDEF)-like protein
MTGVFNRGHLDRVLEAEFRSAVTGGWPLSIVFADLDHFKQVNDTYGHPWRRRSTATANIILDVVRYGLVARYGGEFIIILPTGGGRGKEIAERLLNRLRSFHHPVAGGTLIATASLGLATLHPGAPFGSAAQLLEAADRSVYLAKKRGRDRLVAFDAQELRAAGQDHSPGAAAALAVNDRN